MDSSNDTKQETMDPMPSLEDQIVMEDTPVFLDPGDAVEVKVDDENVPMDEDGGDEQAVDADTASEPVKDMSKATLETHTGQVYAVAAHVDPSTKTLSVLSGGGDDKAFMHKLTPSLSSSYLDHAHTDSVACVAFNTKYVSEDSKKTPKLAAVGGYDGAICIYDLDTATKLQQLEGPSDVEWLSFHPKGGTVLLAGSVADGTVWMYHLPSSKCLQVFVGHESGVTAGAFTKDGRWATSAGSDGTLRIWAPKTGMSKHIFKFTSSPNEPPAGLTCLAVGGGSDGQLLLVGAEDGMAHVCHTATKKVVASLRHFEPPTMQQEEEEEMEYPMSVEAVGFAPSNPNWCATGGVDGVLKIWDLTHDGQCRQVCRPQHAEQQDAADPNNDKSVVDKSVVGGITHLVWHPTLPLVFSSCSDGAVRLWDARNGTLLTSLTGHADVINDLAVEFMRPEEAGGGTAIVVTASDDKTVRVFEVDVATSLQRPVDTSVA